MGWRFRRFSHRINVGRGRCLGLLLFEGNDVMVMLRRGWRTVVFWRTCCCDLAGKPYGNVMPILYEHLGSDVQRTFGTLGGLRPCHT